MPTIKATVSSVKIQTPPKLDSIGPAYQLMEHYFRLAVAINTVPFTYNKERRRFSVSQASIKYVLWFVVMLVGLLVETVQVLRELLRAKNDSAVSRGEWAHIAFVFSSWAFIWSCHYNVAQRQNEMVNHMNQTIALREWFTEARLPKSDDHKIVRAHMISSCMQCFFQCLMVAVEGTKAHFLYSNMPAEYRSAGTGALWALYAYYRVMSNFLSGYFHVFAGVLHVQTCNQVLALRLHGRYEVRENLKYYRMLQILCSRYSEAYSGWFIPQITKFVAENLVLGIYGTVKFYDQMDTDKYVNFPLMTVMMMILVFTFYPKNATVYETTKGEQKQALRRGLRQLPKRAMISILKAPEDLMGEEATAIRMHEYVNGGPQRSCSTKRMVSGRSGYGALKETKCIARSCPTVGIPFGSLYKIKRSTVLNLFNFIACNTISTLLTYP